MRDRGEGRGWLGCGMGAGPQHAILQAYPEAGTVEGLASLLVAVLEETTWVDRVHILQVLLRLLPNISSDLQGQLQGLLIHLLNLDQPPSLQVCPLSCPPVFLPAHPPSATTSPPPASGPDAEEVRDAGAAAAPGLLPGVPGCGAGAHVLLPLLSGALPVSRAPAQPSLPLGRPLDKPHASVPGQSSRSCCMGWAFRTRKASCSRR